MSVNLCACGCGCQPDGDWHWSQQPWCRCVPNSCACVVDAEHLGRWTHPRTGETFLNDYPWSAVAELVSAGKALRCPDCRSEILIYTHGGEQRVRLLHATNNCPSFGALVAAGGAS